MAAEIQAPSALRVKRQVSSKIHRFATILPPGFEDIGLAEARALGLALDPDVTAANVLEWTGRLVDMYRVCLFSRSASRVLVRLDRFHAGAREELYRKTYAFPWELWLAPGRQLRIDAHLEYSRISHEGQAAATVGEAIRRRMSQAGVPLPDPEATDQAEASLEDGDSPLPEAPAASQRVLLRLIDNHAQLSLDCCGDHLHRRGWRKMSGHAPLRENLAAALLLAAAWPQRPAVLVDGMCGSGSFAIEAARLAMGGPAAVGRDFAFCHWPSFAADSYAWLQRQKIVTAGAAVPYSIIANEIDPGILGQAQANAAGAELSQAILWSAGNFFDLAVPEQAGLLVLNPPYGLRLSDGGGSLYPRLLRHLAERWQGWDVLLLGLPDLNLAGLRSKLVWSRSFRHGGLRIGAWLLRP